MFLLSFYDQKIMAKENVNNEQNDVILKTGQDLQPSLNSLNDVMNSPVKCLVA